MTSYKWLIFAFLATFLAPHTGLGNAPEITGGKGYAQKEGVISWYSKEACKWNPDPRCPTANGSSLMELERTGVLFAAKWDVGFGSKFQVCNPASGRCVDVVILDRGPARRLGREIDLCKKAFSQIADPREGIINGTVRRLS